MLVRMQTSSGSGGGEPPKYELTALASGATYSKKTDNIMVCGHQAYSWFGFCIVVEEGVMSLKYVDPRYAFNIDYTDGTLSFVNPSVLGGSISVQEYGIF